MIVDPQVDFICGTLPVSGAVTTMDSLAQYIDESRNEYSHIIVTADRHPFDHLSFERYGGVWPAHCVHDSIGAAVWQPVMDVLSRFDGKRIFLHKGERHDREEYSIFKNENALAEIAEIITEDDIGQIDICGIAGDVCVADTILDGIEIFGAAKFNVLLRFCPSIDGGKRLNEIISKFEISCDR